MSIKIVNSVILLVLMVFPVTVPADERESSSSRWGITTKKNLESTPGVLPEKSESAPDAGTRVVQPTASPDQPPLNSPVNDDGAVVLETARPPSADQQTSAGKQPTTATTRNSMPPQTIDWSSEGQKKACEGYLDELRALFLKTRHFSIQGASCDTAESAAAFLDSMEKCQRNCPDGLLEYSGYTDRIIRNIRYLEKLGNDRCSGSLTPTTKK